MISALFWVWLVFQTAEVSPEAPELSIDATFTVTRQVVDVRVLDRKGRPVTGLSADDFELSQRGETIPILSCDWVGADSADQSRPRQGRLMILFFQVSLTAPRVAGLESKVRRALSVTASLKPGDWVAVVSYDSHLKLWCDFTGSPQAVEQAVRKALRRTRAPYPKPVQAPALSAFLDQEAGKKARTPEKALALLGRALEPFDCSKTLVYLDFDGSDFARGDFRMRRDYPAAMSALTRSRTTVTGLDFSPYEYDTLGLAIRQLAEDTGGFFVKTPNFIQLAVARLELTLSGYYTLSHHVDAPINPDGRFKLKLNGGRGRIMARSPYNSWGDSMTRAQAD